MVKKTKPVETPDEAELLEIIESADELQDAMSRIYAQTGTTKEDSEAIAHVWLVEPDGDSKIWKGSPGEYDLDKLAREHGSGTYRLMVYMPDSTGQVRMRLKKEFKYKLSAEADARLRSIRKGEVPVTGNAPQGGVTLADIEKLIAARIPAAPAVDPFAMMEKMAGMISKMIPAAQAPQGNQLGIKEVFDMSRSMISLVTEANKGGEISDKVRPADRALMRGIDLVADMMAKGADRSLPIQTQQTPPNSMPQLTEDELDEIDMMRLALKAACRAASRNESPEEFADEHYEDINIGVIHTLYNDPKWFDVLCATVAACAQHKAWFERVRMKLITLAQEYGELTPAGQIVETPDDGATNAGAGDTVTGGNGGAGVE